MLLPQNCNPHLRAAQYAVRGPLSIRADEIKSMLETEEGKKELPFSEVINCNIGNPHQLAQKPITYFRQVLALVEWPPLMERTEIFPSDTIKVSREIIEHIKSVGAYSHSQGIPLVRTTIASFLTKRDSVSVDPSSIFMTNGASEGVNKILSLIITDPSVGVMIPIPQYPLYSATISLLNGTAVPYYLEEDGGWKVNIEKIKKQYKSSTTDHLKIKVFCLINPGNPTGSLLEKEEIEEIIDFCVENNLILLADEVYQDNVYGQQTSFTSVLSCLARKNNSHENDNNNTNKLQLFSLQSASKGIAGECGHRGGYFHCHNIDPSVREQLYKQASITLCSNIPGQILMMLLADPPQQSSPSYPLWKEESEGITAELERRSIYIRSCLQSMSGISCQEAKGALYLFPSIVFPPSYLDECRRTEQEPDSKYAMDLLNETGICIVPGNGFGQQKGSFHIRTTFLPPKDQIEGMMERWMKFHENLFKKSTV